MPSDLPQRKALKFLADRLQSQDPFTKQDFGNATGWSGSTRDTHWSKHFKPFVVVIGGGRYRVSEGFRPFANWRKFQRHVTKTRPVAADYTRLAYDNVVMYEFFMPLTNEPALRTTLDALFFKDNIIPKLRAIGAEQLSQHLSIKDGEAAAKYFERICDWIDLHFAGYSLYRVDGRHKSQVGNLADKRVHAGKYAKVLAPYPCCCHVNKREIERVLARHYGVHGRRTGLHHQLQHQVPHGPRLGGERMKLPNVEATVVSEDKSSSYLLSPTHRDGRHKAAFFLGFGFTADVWQTLAAALLKHAADHEVAKVESTPFGTRYVMEGTMETPYGRTPSIRSVWFLENGQAVPRFVTAYPLKGADDD